MELKNRLENEVRDFQGQIADFDQRLKILHTELARLQATEMKLRENKVLSN